MRCAICQTEIPDAHRFCSSCGTPAPTPSQTPTVTASPAAVAARIAAATADAGFTPGMVLAGRYRVIGLLGRGGMGEVYRADDLKLGQPVALKFLPHAFAADPARQDRLLVEVRLARQVAHPNVCRVYDVGEIEGRHFLSMEYVDGEDLRSLLTRIGRLPSDKALDIARQIAAGLSAAHERGVLHRDLKPANVMLDGRGRVRLMDFGLAAATDADAVRDDAGTPAYMAPEQLAGKGASVRSDIYALGLVFYELYTGRRAFEDTSLGGLLAAKERGRVTRPAALIPDMNPAVERVILRAIARDPEDRPASTAHVAAALPGGGALQATLHAGETPSPELVAASGWIEGVDPRFAWALLACALAGAIGAGALASRTHSWRRGAFERPPQSLAETARDIRSRLGQPGHSIGRASGVEADIDHLRYLQMHDTRRARWGDARPSFFRFWYRESPRALESWRFAFRYGGLSRVSPIDPPLTVPGMLLMRLDPGGRLLHLVAVPDPAGDASALPRSPDWDALLAAAGFEPSSWAVVEPRATPPVYADARRAWQGTWPTRPDLPVRLEAGTLHGTTVYFEAIFPWTRPERTAAGILTAGEQAALVPLFAAVAALLVTAAVFATRNLRAGRGDRRGAFRLALFVFATMIVAWFFGESHVPTLGEFTLLIMALAWATLVAFVCWLSYLAAEPFVRRRWPQLLVSWTRVLSGAVRDPLVGRDVLVGCAGGTVIAIMGFAETLLPGLLGLKPNLYPVDLLGFAFDLRTVLPLLVWRCAQSVIGGLTILFAVLLFRLVLPSQRKAMAGFVAAAAVVMALPFEHFWISLAVSLLFGAAMVLLLRVGLLALVVAIYSSGVFMLFPVTIDLDAWYAGAGVTATLVYLMLAAFGFTAALRGRPTPGRAAPDAGHTLS